ncbi:MAG TPA: DNA alkylation repair protein [Candidatus Omnitrophota bacterium]|nr:DNA alkylation repair protein [Candidatus Omnitrophota bacterium]HPT06622.1 DNA alkylation repair protein [Candidatus Omnitrophota bacterium]
MAAATAAEARRKLRLCASYEKARILGRFFKTGPGEYGFGDVFLGVSVPDIRLVSREYFRLLPQQEITKLGCSPYHEERMLALCMQVLRFQKPDEFNRRKIYVWYMKHTAFINNWDLVDCSAAPIVGAYLWGKDVSPLYAFSRSPQLWKRRIAIVATHYFIKQGRLGDTLAITTILLQDTHDLIHKACGWMLREAGKKDSGLLEDYLQQYASRMPRTMLRYAIERFPETKRRFYLRAH